MKDWANWLAVALMLVTATAGTLIASQVVRRGITEVQEAYDLDTGQSYGSVTVTTVVPLPPDRKNARIGLRPTKFRPGVLSSARTELRLNVECEDANREVLDAAGRLAYLWQTGTIEQVLDAIARFPEKRTGCDVSIHPSRWTAHP